MTHLSPGIRNVEPYPFEALDRRKADALASGRDLIDFGVGDPREVTAPFIREALGAAIEPISSYPRAAGLPELRGAIAGWLERAVPGDGGCRDGRAAAAGFEGDRVLAGAGGPGSRRWQGSRDRHGARIHDPGTGCPVRGRRGPPPAVDGTPWVPARPGLDRRRHLGTGSDPVAELPEQPDRGRRAAGVLPGGGGTLPGARRAAGLRRGLQRALVRRWPSRERAPGGRPLERPGRQHTVQAFVDDRLPEWVRGRGPRN